MKRADANSFYLHDGLGSTRQLTANNEAVVASYTYDSFGSLIASSGSATNPYGFTGEQQFSEADNLVYLRARYYSPQIGRFISRDPIGYVDGLNLYTYVKNNSTNYIDPSGKLLWTCFWCGFYMHVYYDACMKMRPKCLDEPDDPSCGSLEKELKCELKRRRWIKICIDMIKEGAPECLKCGIDSWFH
ncbi:MAG: RHS repeat-associated core domain-containing protein [Phycisphaerae bacterium]|nr:RHS repeat-associated core domain-containing protein [Phycisphaerae bacterium]MDD5380726.1 RHS repeat-associated core domain-containing protein [Phycisphaerae bacterium]